MSTTYLPYALELELPWSGHKEREAAFKKALKRVLIPLFLLFLIVPWLAIFEAEKAPQDPKIMTKILLDPPKLVPPPPPPPPQVIREELQPVKPAKTPESPKPKVVPKSQPVPVAKAPKVDARTQVAQSQGLSELSSQLKSLRGTVNVAKMQNKNVSINDGGTIAASDRSVLGSKNIARKSDGIVVDENVMRGESVALAQHQSTKVEGVVGGDSDITSELGQLSGQSGKRDMESIRRTLEQTKGNVYSLYQRALLDHPNLSGKFTFKIVIEPNGSISMVKLVASELGISELEQRILERIRQVNFGAKDVPPTAVEYKFVFLPS
jgi:outer membrane biosynthesis protein TonB